MHASDTAVVAIYTELLEAWNRQDADAFAALFARDAAVTGFDGSQMQGSDDIATQLAQIFAHHRTASYVARIQEVRTLAPTVTLLRAAVGMIPPGRDALDPERNAIQSLVVVTDDASGKKEIAHFQNTPAAFHGRPALRDAMTQELPRIHEAGIVVDATP